jgi:hypothetical protein
MTSAFDDAFLADILGDDDPAPPWPPEGFVTPPWVHPVSARAYALHRYGQQLRYEELHFPERLAVRAVEHAGVQHPIVLLGIRMMSRSSTTAAGRIPRTSDGRAWGGVVEIDGRDLFDRREVWAAGEDGQRAAVVTHDKSAEDITMTIFAVAVMASEGMKVRRYEVRQDGTSVEGSAETLAIEGGVVRRVEGCLPRLALTTSPPRTQAQHMTRSDK